MVVKHLVKHWFLILFQIDWNLEALTSLRISGVGVGTNQRIHFLQSYFKRSIACTEKDHFFGKFCRRRLKPSGVGSRLSPFWSKNHFWISSSFYVSTWNLDKKKVIFEKNVEQRISRFFVQASNQTLGLGLTYRPNVLARISIMDLVHRGICDFLAQWVTLTLWPVEPFLPKSRSIFTTCWLSSPFLLLVALGCWMEYGMSFAKVVQRELPFSAECTSAYIFGNEGDKRLGMWFFRQNMQSSYPC